MEDSVPGLGRVQSELAAFGMDKGCLWLRRAALLVEGVDAVASVGEWCIWWRGVLLARATGRQREKEI